MLATNVLIVDQDVVHIKCEENITSIMTLYFKAFYTHCPVQLTLYTSAKTGTVARYIGATRLMASSHLF